MASRFKTVTLEKVTELREAAKNLDAQKNIIEGEGLLHSGGVIKIALRKTWRWFFLRSFTPPRVNKTEPICQP